MIVLKAFLEGTDIEVRISDKVINFRGEEGVLTGIHRARTPGKSGKVTVNDFGSNYDKVWGLEIRDIIEEGED